VQQGAARTFMVVRPKQFTIEQAIKSLNLSIVESGTKEAYVDLKPKFTDHRVISELAHYSI